MTSPADDAAAAFAARMAPGLCAGLAGGWGRDGDGAAAMVTGCPAPTLNAVIAYRHGSADAAAALLDEIAAAGYPHCLQTREGDDAAERLARDRGMVATERVPLMLLHGAADLVAANDGVTIRSIGPDELPLHLELMVAGFETPAEVFAPMRDSTVLSQHGVTTYVALDDGEPVATALGTVSGGWVGVLNVATVPRHRRRGYGAALTARAVLDGLDAGAHSALLQSSRMGLPVYERLGFRTAEHWTVWLAEPPA